MKASDMSFIETTVTPKGKPGHRGHHYLWGRCERCGDVQLVRRAGFTKRKCVMTPGCKGPLVPAEDAQHFGGPVILAQRELGAVVIDVVEGRAAG